MSWTGTCTRRLITDARAERHPADGVTLQTPDEVSAWILATIVEVSKDADADAQAKNVLRTYPGNIYAGVARRGQSVYASVHATATEVWDIRADRMDDGCVSAKGHNFVKNDKGEWRCAKCGALM